MTQINAPHMTATRRQQLEEAAKLPACRSLSKGRKELGYGG